MAESRNRKSKIVLNKISTKNQNDIYMSNSSGVCVLFAELENGGKYEYKNGILVAPIRHKEYICHSSILLYNIVNTGTFW